MFVDLDRFKTINDSLGHAVGDVLLKEVAERLVKQLRDGDTICRIGGDEFVVVLPEVKRSSDVAQVAQKIIEQLSQPVVIEERELIVTPLDRHRGLPRRRARRRDADPQRRRRDVPRQGDGARQLPVLHRADEPAGVAAPRAGGRPAARARPRRDAPALPADRRHGERQGRRARGAAALAAPGARPGAARRIHPGGRGHRPDPQDRRVGAARGLLLGHLHRHRADSLPVNVNLSARQFNDPKLPQLVVAALRETGLPPRAARARDHRVDRDAADRRHAHHAEEAEGPRRLDRHRRLRHRLLEPRVPEALPGRQAEDRPHVRRRGHQDDASSARSSRPSSRSRTRSTSR